MAKPFELPQRKLCPTCGKPLAVRERTDGRKELTCPTCDGPDPLHSPKAIGWTKSSLQPPKRPE
ncbi:hypothetical protein ACQR1W_37010 [Bradyrhizobium sp. HKCCYLS1011]|uniref:hypothetical protein n=1 Tax=Bradyrhizobium sp. HKCCYLS1011 TaxID=3420733 RepID=UPI003EBEB5CA